MSQLLTLFNRSNASPLPPTATLVLPAGALAVYSVVKTPTWGGACCRIKRASDSTQTDVGFTASGYMDTVAALAFAAGSVISVVTWYDQSGNGYDAITNTSSPTIYSGNAIAGIQPITFCQSSGAGNSRLDIPVGLSVSTQNFTACMAYASGGGMANFNALFSIGTQIHVWFEKPSSVLKGDGISSPSASALNFTPRHGQVDSVIRSGNASNSLLQVNGNTYSSTALAAASPTGATIGGFATVPPSTQEVFAYAIYGTALSTGDKALVDTAFSTTFKANTPFTSKIVCDGDSITSAFTTGAYCMGFPRVVSSINGQGAAIYNVGIPGQSMNAMYTNRATVTSRYDVAYAKNVCVVFGGTNDIDNRATGTIVGYGTTVWTSYLLLYIRAMYTAGFSRVCVGTAIARNWVGSAQDKIDKEAERLVYNQLIRDNAAAEGYTVLDFAGLSEMSDYADTTYIVDAVHPTRTGYNVMGTYAAPIIAAWV